MVRLVLILLLGALSLMVGLLSVGWVDGSDGWSACVGLVGVSRWIGLMVRMDGVRALGCALDWLGGVGRSAGVSELGGLGCCRLAGLMARMDGVRALDWLG